MQTERWHLIEIELNLACALANLYVRRNGCRQVGYSARKGPEMSERRANKERLSEERLESSPEVDRVLYKHTIIIIINNFIRWENNWNVYKSWSSFIFKIFNVGEFIVPNTACS